MAGLLLLVGTERALSQSKPVTGEDNPTAYTALRVISKDLGHDALERVVEVTGRDGAPQPYLWKVVLKEGEGSREVDVAGGKIEAQRALTRPAAASTPIHLADLNLDSSGAFDATDVQARKVKLRYDSLNYALRVSATTKKPVWMIDLLNKEGSNVGVIRLAAHDGTILSTEGRLANNPPPASDTNRTVAKGSTNPPTTTTTTTVRSAERPSPTPRITRTVTTTTTVRAITSPSPIPSPATTTSDIPVATLSDREDGADTVPNPPSEEGGLFTRTGRTLDKTSRTVEHHLRRAGATVQRFFTGHSDVDQEDRRD